LAGVHDVFHVSQLKKCSSEVRVEHLPLEELEVKDDLTYKDIQSKSWILHKGLPAAKLLGCARCGGVTIQRMRLHGKERMSLRKNSFSCSLIFLNLGTTFS
jgi:hypothetical protein